MAPHDATTTRSGRGCVKMAKSDRPILSLIGSIIAVGSVSLPACLSLVDSTRLSARYAANVIKRWRIAFVVVATVADGRAKEVRHSKSHIQIEFQRRA